MDIKNTLKEKPGIQVCGFYIFSWKFFEKASRIQNFRILEPLIDFIQLFFDVAAPVPKNVFPLKNLNFGGKPVEGYATHFSHIPLINEK